MLGFLESPKKPKDSFIAQTADDYDMSITLVEEIYARTGGGVEFYEELESELKQRRNK